jgi:hypothetical protein
MPRTTFLRVIGSIAFMGTVRWVSGGLEGRRSKGQANVMF